MTSDCLVLQTDASACRVYWGRQHHSDLDTFLIFCLVGSHPRQMGLSCANLLVSFGFLPTRLVFDSIYVAGLQIELDLSDESRNNESARIFWILDKVLALASSCN